MKNDFEKLWEEEEFTQLVGALSSYVHPGEFYFEINHGRKLDQKYTQFFFNVSLYMFEGICSLYKIGI